MAHLVLLIAAVPAIALSVWSDVGSVHEGIEKRRLDASNLSLPGDYHTLYVNRLADTMALNWAGIEGAMKFANSNPEYRQQVELLVEAYFACIDEMAAEVECRRRRANLG